ncbi:MAG: outer membrane lipoprotein-sorting protein [Gammaproteobacteria bacterium]|nr:outer membrane lipoprotein-sorting protein [Gammaproteobacteria bacterium]
MTFARVFFICVFLVYTPFAFAQKDARQIIKDAIDKYRGETSYTEMEMVIHRPSWERSMSMKGWTQGLDKSLVRITAPKKDAGAGNLLLNDNMWSYTPKINRVVKIPSSMSNQSWMGSDFSNNDISRADNIINQYTHTLVATEKHEGKDLYIIESVPHDDAPVVWGKEVVKIRDDDVILEHAFYDQDGKLIKSLTTRELKTFSNRTVPSIQRMQSVDKPDEWTEIRMKNVRYGIRIPERTFTLTNLRNPR